MTNTEKPTTKQEAKKQGIASAPKIKASKTTLEISKKKEKELIKEKTEKFSDKKEKSKSRGKKKQIKIKSKVKRDYAVVNAKNLAISTKHSIAICKFIKNKKIKKAISDLEQVISFKKVVPMRGEIPHKKGKRIMSGRYPKKASKHFIKLLKSLSANSNVAGLEEPIIAGALANIAPRPFGKFGRIRKKRTHIKISAKSK